MKVSKEIEILNGKEGKLSDVIKPYLDAKKAHYITAGHEGVQIKGARGTYVGPGSIIIERDNKKYIIEELGKVCGLSGRFHERDEFEIDAIMDNKPQGRIVFRTFKNKKDLYVHVDQTPSEPTGSQSILIKDILKEPSNIPDNDETYEINCNCKTGLKCIGTAWQ